MLLPPTKKKIAAKRNNRILSLSPSASPFETNATVKEGQADSSPSAEEIKASIERDGIEPSDDRKIEIDDWEKKAGRILTEDDTEEVGKMVSWCYVSSFLCESDQGADDSIR